MNLYLKTTTALLALLFLAGCQKDDSDDTPDPEAKKSEWYQIVSFDTLTSSQVIQGFAGFGADIGQDLVRVSFLYHSPYDTATLTLSGCVCWPVGLKECSKIWLENHFTTIRWDQCPSQMGQPGMTISIIQNTIYIGADYQGLGLSRDLPQPYFNTVLTADQSIDCFRAALSLLKEWGPNVTDDYSTYCIGYSLGGAVTLGIARRAELDPEVKRLLNLKKSYCGDGPYNMETMIDFFFSDTSKPLEYPISLPCAIRTALYASPLLNSSYTESDFFSDAFMESGLLELLDTKEYDTDQMNEILNNSGFNTTGSILSKEVLNPDSQIARQFYHELKLVDLTSGWSPTTPIWLFHAKKDDTVPVACLEKLLDNMEGNPNISYYIKPSGNHHESGTDFYTSVLLGVRL